MHNTVRPEPVEGLLPVTPVILSLSKGDKLSPNGFRAN